VALLRRCWRTSTASAAPLPDSELGRPANRSPTATRGQHTRPRESTVCRVDGGRGKPVVARDLPWNGGQAERIRPGVLAAEGVNDGARAIFVGFRRNQAIGTARGRANDNRGSKSSAQNHELPVKSSHQTCFDARACGAADAIVGHRAVRVGSSPTPPFSSVRAAIQNRAHFSRSIGGDTMTCGDRRPRATSRQALSTNGAGIRRKLPLFIAQSEATFKGPRRCQLYNLKPWQHVATAQLAHHSRCRSYAEFGD